MTKRLFAPKDGPPAVGPYSPAVAANGFLFVSGQIPLNPATGELVTDSFENQVRQTLDNLKSVVESAGITLDEVVKVTIFVVDLANFGELNQIYEEYIVHLLLLPWHQSFSFPCMSLPLWYLAE